MKKILAVLLAVLTVFSCTAMFAAAEDVTEPEQTVMRYDICQDPDFLEVVYLEKGNDKATLIKPGDIITTYKTTQMEIKYYPDADGMYKGDWVPADPNNLAFSISGKESISQLFKKNVDGVVADISDTDFTIAYSDENTFLGWVIYDYEASSNKITLCGVWEKNHKITQADETDDFEYILNVWFTARQKIAAPFVRAIRWLSNAILFVKVWLYNVIFGAETAA